MALLPRGLWIALILWLASSRPSTASRTESPDSAQWWGTEEFSSIQKASERLRRASDYAGLEKLYLEAVVKAKDCGNLRAQTTYLTALGNTYVYLFHYTDALEAYTQARDLAHSSGDWLAEGAVAPGLSSVYLLVGDWPEARKSARAGVEVANRLAAPPYYDAQLKLQNARLNAGSTDSGKEILLAIEAARKASNVALEAEAWDLLGEERIGLHDLAAAELALDEAHRLRVRHLPMDLRLSYWRLGGLRLAQGRLDEAERLTTAAIYAHPQAGAALPGRTLLHQRGLILNAQGRTELALQDFEAAAQSAERWRQVVPRSVRTSLAAADNEADGKVFRTFIEIAARQALATGDLKWARKAFLAAARNRAASLRQFTALAQVWRRKLPPKYWEILAQLHTEESRQIQRGSTLDPSQMVLSEKLNLELTEMEAAVGLRSSPNKSESFSAESSLSLFQKGLRESELHLSFYTGATESYLWAVSRDSLHLYKLPAADRIEKEVQSFRNAIVQHESQAARLGEKLYSTLLGQLDARESSRSSWMLSLEGPLVELPVAALRSGSQYLVETHSLQLAASPHLLDSSSSTSEQGSYLAVGDPIYNWADERLRPAQWSVRQSPFEIPGQLNRLVASGDELQRIAHVWGNPATLLQGVTASRSAFLHSVSDAPPSTIHLATHIVSNDAQQDEVYLAFSVGAGGSPELLGPADVAMLHVPDALVVMTGCYSGNGEVRPGVGLLGLTHAWFVAGARAVVVTGWPVEDSRGDLLSAFYKNLTSSSTAEALRRGQVEMIHSGTWQSDPAYWAAFRLTGGAR